MWQSRAHILKLLMDQSGLKKREPSKWTDEMQQAFDTICLLMAANALAAYPDHNKRFDVYTDASYFQVGACVIQEGRPVAYFLQKLTKYQQNYKRICPSRGSIGRIRSRFGVKVRSFSWNRSLRNGGVLGESLTYFHEASRRLNTGQEWDWHAPDTC
jgi:hypothetical protein